MGGAPVPGSLVLGVVFMSQRWVRVLALTGALWMVLIVVGNDVLGDSGSAPGVDDPPSAFAEYYANEIDTVAWVSVAIDIAGFGFGLVFVGFIASRLREAGSFGSIAGVAGAVALAIKLGSAAPQLTAMYRADEGLDPEIVKTLIDLNGFAFLITFLPLGIFAIATSLGALSAGIAPKWTCWLGVVSGSALFVGMPLAVSGPGFLGMLAFIVWTVAFSVAMAIRPGPAVVEQPVDDAGTVHGALR